MKVFVKKQKVGGSHNPWKYSAYLVEDPSGSEVLSNFDNQGNGYSDLRGLGHDLARHPQYKLFLVFPEQLEPRVDLRSGTQIGRITDDELTEILKGVEVQDRRNRTKGETDPKTGTTRVYTEPAQAERL